MYTLSTDDLDPIVREHIRAKWEVEINQHNDRRQRMTEERSQWESEIKQHNDIRLEWEVEVNKHNDLHRRMSGERSQWEFEIKQHNDIRLKWEVEVNKHNDLRQCMADERSQLDSERQAWEEMRLGERKEALEEHRRAREKEEEEEERRRAGIYWLELVRAPHCTKYGTREYRAKLGPVGWGVDQLKACRETEIEIHGRMIKPNRCDDMGMFNGVWGVWMVDFDEGACRTFWGDYKDKGCTAPGSGLRHIEANLKNHDAADEWTAMCTTTPYDFNGLHFDGAISCANWGKYGIFGFWDIEDKNCV